MTKFRVLTANLCSVDQTRRQEALAETLASHVPDVVVVQESTDPEQLLSLLSSHLGQCAASLYFNNNRKNPENNEHLMVAVFGDAVSPETIDIATRPSTFAGSAHLGRIGLLKPRTTGRIDISFDQDFTVHAVHHDWADGTTLWHTSHRIAQMRQLLADMSGPSIVAGDFNNGLGSPSVRKLMDDPRVIGAAVTVPTWPAQADTFWQNNLLGAWSAIARWPERKRGVVLPNGELPRATIDNIYHTQGIHCIGSTVEYLHGSDHLAVVGDYELQSP